MQAFQITEFKSGVNEYGSVLNVNIDMIQEFYAQNKHAFEKERKGKIITCIGDYGIGKSTTLNALCSYAIRSGTKPFVSASKSDTTKRQIVCNTIAGCTKGLQGAIIETKDECALFIDVQGLLSLESQTDPIVLLYCYGISDIIIVNIQEKFDDRSLEILDLITKYSKYFKEASCSHKPHILFRVMNADADTNSHVLNAQYGSMVLEKNMYQKMTKFYADNYFNKTDPPFIWTGRPDAALIKEYDRSGNILEFIANTKGYPEACKEFWNTIYNKVPCRTISILQHLIDSATAINANFSKLTYGPIDIDDRCDDNIMKEWLDSMLNNSGKYYNLTQLPDVMNCSSDTHTVIRNREYLVAEFEKDFVRLFSGSKSFNYGMGIFKTRIKDIYDQMVEIFKTHRMIVTKNIKEKIKQIIDNNIQVSEKTWISSDLFNDTTSAIIGQHKVSHTIGTEILEEIHNQGNLISAKFLKYREIFLNLINVHVNNYKNHIYDQKRKYINFINEYVGKLEYRYTDITGLYFKEMSDKFDIIIDIEEKNISVLATIPQYNIVFDDDYNMVDLKESDMINRSYVLHVDSDLLKNYTELRYLCESYEVKFTDARKKVIPGILAEINKVHHEHLSYTFSQISHNNLFMFNFENDNSIEFKIMASNPLNMEIMNQQTYNGRFPDKIRKIHAVYLSTADDNEREYCRTLLVRLISEETLFIKGASVMRRM